MANRYFAAIKSYSITINRNAPAATGEFNESWRRKITLNLEPGGSNVRKCDLLFFDDSDASGSLGTKKTDTYLSIYGNNFSDYRDTYDALRYEKPLNFVWQEIETGAPFTNVDTWRIMSGNEPLGEGNSEN